ncbi:MAG: hypothetical protein ACYDDA_07885 [Acidiferrobacteraceae bacterium]
MKQVHARLIESGIMVIHNVEYPETAAAVLDLRVVLTTIVVRSGIVVDSILGCASEDRLARWISSRSMGGAA